MKTLNNLAIIIRTKNEERWIGRCLRMVFAQSRKDIDVIIVDNKSTDHTLHIAKKFPVKILEIDNFRPGAAINLGFESTKADLVVCLSAHCIPKDEFWLENLVKAMEEHPNAAGAYGRQLPFAYSSDLDKRDLFITFGLDRRVQIKDHFFHNANSIIRRKVWMAHPFDNETTNIEDRIWGKEVISSGHQIVYEPEAAVFHFHGIHQQRDERRASNIVRIMESLEKITTTDYIPEGFNPNSLRILAILPLRGNLEQMASVNLLERALNDLKGAKYRFEIALISENEQALALAKKMGAFAIQRPESLLSDSVGLEQVLRHCLLEQEGGDQYFDAVLYVNYLYPFRPKNYFDRIVDQFCLSGVDSILPTIADYQPCWMEANGVIVKKDAAFLPKQKQSPTQRGIAGVGTLTSSEFIRAAQLLGNHVSLIPLANQIYSLKVGDTFSNRVLSQALGEGPALFGADETK